MPRSGREQGRRSVEELRFPRDDLSALLERAEAVRATRRGWITFSPVPVDEETSGPDATSVLTNFVTGPRHELALCSWVPAKAGRRRQAPDAVGIQHNAGPKVERTLEEIGVPVPSDWRRVQDHPRRGLVLELPEGYDLFVCLGWLVRAGSALTRVPVTGSWAAQVHGSGR